MINKHLKLSIFAFLLIFSTPHSFALGKVSRACKVAYIPNSILGKQVMRFFEKIGTAPIGSLEALLELPIEQRFEYVILESITVDVYNRYYLFAEANITRKFYSPYDTYEHNDFNFKRYASPGFELLSFPNELENYLATAGSTFVFNRKKLYSSRAGHSNIVEYLPSPYSQYGNFFGRYDTKYEVVGRHFFYNPKEGIARDLKYSKASTCNLMEWGDPLSEYSISDR